MGVKKIVGNIEMKSLSEVITICKELTVENHYKSERAKSPARKRVAKTNASFWGSVAYYLGIVEAMTDDEVLHLEDRVKGKKGGENGS